MRRLLYLLGFILISSLTFGQTTITVNGKSGGGSSTGGISPTDSLFHVEGIGWVYPYDTLGTTEESAFYTMDFVNDSVAPSHLEGRIFYDTLTKTVSYYTDITDVTMNIGEELWSPRVLNVSGAQIDNGRIVRIDSAISGILTIELADNRTILESTVLGVTTHNIANGSYGRVTLFGMVNGIDMSSYDDGQILYLDTMGYFIDTIPNPPQYKVSIGQVGDNLVNGSFFVKVAEPIYTPQPIITAGFIDSNIIVDNTVLNQYEQISNATNSAYIVDQAHGFTLSGDTSYVLQDGHYNIFCNTSFIGNTQSDVWIVGVFINGVRASVSQRTTSSSDIGNLSVLHSAELNIGDYVTFSVTNTSNATRDATFRTFKYIITYTH